MPHIGIYVSEEEKEKLSKFPRELSFSKICREALRAAMDGDTLLERTVRLEQENKNLKDKLKAIEELLAE